jgi:hypothetical protein
MRGENACVRRSGAMVGDGVPSVHWTLVFWWRDGEVVGCGGGDTEMTLVGRLDVGQDINLFPRPLSGSVSAELLLLSLMAVRRYRLYQLFFSLLLVQLECCLFLITSNATGGK